MQTAKALGADPDEIYFTSGGSESDNWAIKGWLLQTGSVATTSSRRRSSTMQCSIPASFLKKEGFEVTYLPVDRYGLVDPVDLRKGDHRQDDPDLDYVCQQ